MPEHIDPELYLRLLAERTLLEGERAMPWGGAVERAGAALAAAGVLAQPVADAIAADYALAAEVRGQRGGQPPRRLLGNQSSPTAAVALQTSRVVPGPIEVTLSWGELTLRWVRFGADETSIAVEGRMAGSLSSGRAARKGPPPFGEQLGGPPALQVADDRGRKGIATFSGGWGAYLKGTFTLRPPLSDKTGWLELDGQRVVIVDQKSPAVSVAIEPLPAQPRGVAYLWHELALSPKAFFGAPRDPDASIEALIAVGAIEDSDQQLENFGRVAAALSRESAPVARTAGQLPEPWASLLAQRARVVAGATRTIPVGALTPSVDGVAVAVQVLEAEENGFSLDVETAPGWGLHNRFSEAGRFALSWWVEDDRGGVYLGHVANFGGSADHMAGTVRFTGGLDPTARELRILPTGLSERAVITISKPWEDHRPEPGGIR